MSPLRRDVGKKGEGESMSLERCDKHDYTYDTDFIENCPRCEHEQEAALEADRQVDEKKLRQGWTVWRDRRDLMGILRGFN